MNTQEMKELFCKPTDERALLAYCMKNIDRYYDLAHKISENDFLLEDHSILYSVLGTLAKQDVKKFDLPLVINITQQAFGDLRSIGGIEYLQSISEMSITDSNFDIYLTNVLESSTKFQLYKSLREDLNKVEQNAKDGDSGADLIGYIESKILDLSTSSKAIKEPRNFSDGLDLIIEERRKNPLKLMGLETGYHILDRQIDGLVPGTLNVVAARPKMGKSAFLSNIATYAAYMSNNPVPVLYVDTEMSFEQWRDRIIASMANMRERDVKHGGYDNETHARIIEQCLNVANKGKLFHEFMPGYSVEKLVALYKKYKLKHDIGLMIFDYIKEPDSSSIDRQRREYQILGDVATKLKDLAGELNIPCLTAVQINREGNVADSDRIARYADVIMQWMYRAQKEIEAKGREGGFYKIVVRETRRGGMTPEEGIGYKFQKEKLRIMEAAPPDQLINYGDKVVNFGDSNDEVR